MIKQTNTVFKDARIKIEANAIQCENHTIQITNISQIWTGRIREANLTLEIIASVLLINMTVLRLFDGLFAGLTALACIGFLTLYHMVRKDEGLHVQLCSGDVYSFISENESFVNKVYLLLNQIIMNKKDMVNYSIIFEGGGEIVDHFAIPKEEPKALSEETKEMKTEEPAGWNERLISELQTLYKAYYEKNVVDPGILSLIEQTADKIKSKDVENIKELYENYIRLGVINECNDLGLNVLIDEIKKRIFS